MSGLFFNLRGREAEGTVDPAAAPALAQELAAGLTGLRDPDGGAVAVRRALPRDLAYRGDQVHAAPDVLLCCAPGYRISSASAMGGVPDRVMEDNTHRWSGDHVVDPDAVPGVLFMNQAFDDAAPAITDLAPTILSALGAPRGPEMEGRSLVS
jgi:predicted AlkP superfamily phosphohydrolase/phosphomutase